MGEIQDNEAKQGAGFEEAPGSESIVVEIWSFLKVRKKFWLAPIIIALLLLAGLFVLASQAGVVSPFIYAL
jgi:Family of unknown function (DUF5989)